MNSYTLIFNKKINTLRWLKFSLFGLFFSSIILFTVNYIVDPYSITKYNILNIKYKFARDDRNTKVKYFKTKSNIDNILIGSSRVYSINPKIVDAMIGGKTYNFGVGTATVEDHLGIIKYLERNNKLPKRLIIGLDFYTFNKDLPLNKYFLRNKDLNFLSFAKKNDDYLAKFFSVDSSFATFKTLKNHLKKEPKKPRFDENGWGGYKKGYLDYSKIDLKKENLKTKKEILKIKEQYYSNYKYSSLDKKRTSYYLTIKEICERNNIELILFTTPLHPFLLKEIFTSNGTKKAMNEFITFFSSFDNFVNLYKDKEFYSKLKNFNGATHTTVNAGDVILKKVLENRNELLNQ